MTYDEAQQKIDRAQDDLEHMFDDDRTREEGIGMAVGAGLIAAAQGMLELARALKESDEQIDNWSKDLHTKILARSDLLIYVSALLGRAVIKDHQGEVWVLVGNDTETTVADIYGNGFSPVERWATTWTHAFPYTVLDGMDMVTAAERLASDGKNL